jgi:2',3'-cyclic-nucleotide 2'-phosphodiesterase (5'-nucleotidase family)
MNDWIVRANEVMGLDVVNLGFHDLLYAGSLLKANAKLKPEKSSLISANIKNTDADRASLEPYVIKIVTGKRLPQPVRIAFIGLSDVAPAERKDHIAKNGFVIEDPLAAAKAALAEVRDKADITVIVGYMNLRTANKLAMQNDDLDRRRRSGDRLRSEAGQQRAGRLRGQGDQASGRTAVLHGRGGRGRTLHRAIRRAG